MSPTLLKTRPRGRALAAALALTLAAPLAWAQATSLQLAPGGKLWLDGNSTLHRYRADATRFQARFTADAEAGQDLEALIRDGRVKGLELTVPVSGLTSGEGGLDDNLRKALKSPQFPEIRFSMASYQVLPPASPGAAFGLKLQGKLSVAGVERPAELTTQVTRTGEGLRLTGSHALLMSDFKVEAPVLMLGAIRTDDRVVISFDLKLQRG